jgi:hypothetical protein
MPDFLNIFEHVIFSPGFIFWPLAALCYFGTKRHYDLKQPRAALCFMYGIPVCLILAVMVSAASTSVAQH